MRMKKAERLQKDAEILRAGERFLYATEYVDAAQLAELDNEETFLSTSRLFGCGHYGCGGL
jgi:hypothetical protein